MQQQPLKNKNKNLFNSCMKAVLLCGSKPRFVTEGIKNKLQAFINGCLQYILKFWWRKKITNTQLW
jgi:hypothetical protein